MLDAPFSGRDCVCRTWSRGRAQSRLPLATFCRASGAGSWPGTPIPAGRHNAPPLWHIPYHLSLLDLFGGNKDGRRVVGYTDGKTGVRTEVRQPFNAGEIKSQAGRADLHSQTGL